MSLDRPKDVEPNVYDCLSGEVTLDDAAHPTGIERLSLVASTPDLAGANVELPRLPGSERRLGEALGSVRDRFEFTARPYLDTPAGSRHAATRMSSGRAGCRPRRKSPSRARPSRSRPSSAA